MYVRPLANNPCLSVEGKGTIRIKKLIKGNWYDSTLKISCRSLLRKNLFFEGVLTDKGMKSLKESNPVKINKDDKEITINLIVDSDESLKLWHERLGHVNLKPLRKMANKVLVTGVEFRNNDISFVRPVLIESNTICSAKDNITVLNVLQPRSRVCDLCGPMDTSFVILCIIQRRFYRLTCSLLQQIQEDVLDCFKNYNNLVKNNFEIII